MLVAPFESNQSRWMKSRCINIANAHDLIYQLTTSFKSPEFGARAVVEAFDNLLHRYLKHPESKSLGPDGRPCIGETRGLLQRAHIVAANHRRIGKESDRRWEEGEDFESLMYAPIEFERSQRAHSSKGKTAIARESLIRKIKKIGIRALVRFGCSRRILERMSDRKPVLVSVLEEYEKRVEEYTKTKDPIQRILGNSRGPLD